MHDRLMRDVRVGDTVEITGTMLDDPAPLPVGARGEVTDVMNEGRGYGLEQLVVEWDPETSGGKRSLMLVPGDPFEVVQNKES